VRTKRKNQRTKEKKTEKKGRLRMTGESHRKIPGAGKNAREIRSRNLCAIPSTENNLHRTIGEGGRRR